MSHLLKKHIHELEVLKSCKKCQRDEFLKKSSPDLIKCICEVCLNILNGNIPLTSEQKKKLESHRNFMRFLVKNKGKNFTTQKRAAIVQKGGFLPLILGPLLTIAASLLTK